MREFVDFILRTYGARQKRRGSLVEILIKNEIVAVYFLKSDLKSKLHIYHDSHNDLTRKLQEVVRFKFAMNNNRPIYMNNNQCTGRNCFKYLIDDFPEEWKTFNGNCENRIENSDTKSVTHETKNQTTEQTIKYVSSHDTESESNHKTKEHVSSQNIEPNNEPKVMTSNFMDSKHVSNVVEAIPVTDVVDGVPVVKPSENEYDSMAFLKVLETFNDQLSTITMKS